MWYSPGDPKMDKTLKKNKDIRTEEICLFSDLMGSF